MAARIAAAYLAGALSFLAAVAGAAAEPADMVLHHGKVVTMDDAKSIRSAIAIKDGRILAVGGEDIVARYPAPTVIDLKGRTLSPGFDDTHVHILGVSRRFIDLRDVKSIADLQARIAAKAKELGPGEWITGANGMIFNLAEKRRPDKRDLDKAAPNNPVAVQFNHATYGDSMALKLAGITKATPQPDRGVIEMGADGEPNGVIRERGDLYTALIPFEKAEDLRPGFEAEIRRLVPMGITSIIIPGTPIDTQPRRGGRLLPSWPELQDIYARMGDQLPRAAAMIEWPGAEKLKAFPHHTGWGDDRLRLGGIGEMGLDGGLTGPTAWTLHDYKGTPGFRGKAKFTREEYQAAADLGAQLGWQFGIHAIGDAAIQEAVEVFDEALRKYPHPDHRWYMGHFTVMPPAATMQLMAKDHIWIGQQPNFEYALEPQYEMVLNDEDMRHNNAIATPIDKYGIFMAFGSDNIPIGPTVGLYAAVTRKGVSGKVWGPEERVSAYDALKMYTRNGPYFTWEEKTKGTLEPGKLADMIVLDRDPLTVPPEQLLQMQVDYTIIGGKVVYDRSGAMAPSH